MPVVILLDASLSMARPCYESSKENSKDREKECKSTRASLAAAGVNALLDHLALHSRLEFVALVAFSSLCEVACGFTRDYDALRAKLRALDDYDKTCLEGALAAAYRLVAAEWGHRTHAHVVLVTDGCVDDLGPLAPPAFPCTLSVLCVAPPNDPHLHASTPIYRRLLDSVGANDAPRGTLYMPDQALNTSSVTAMFRRFCNEQLAPWRGVVRCGNLEARITLAPAPTPYTHVTDFDSIKMSITNSLEICGFISVSDIGSSTAISKHLIFPAAPPPTSQTAKLTKSDSTPELPTTPDEDAGDSGKIPNFCVLLHGALKVENLAGLVQLGDDWYGMIHSWADSKKKSNLMLSIFSPGDDAAPWLGPLGQLGIQDPLEPGEVFPVRITERRSYSSAGSGAGASATWVHPAGLQTDLQKLLRHARKLPDKVNHFYKEVNRVRRAALALGWIEALEAAANVLEREISSLPQGAKMPLSMAAHHLRNPNDPKSQLPLG